MISNLTIFEGVDGCGKTTAARKYAAYIGAEYVHSTLDLGNNSNLTSYYLQLMMPALTGKKPVVMDRCWISEPVYGHVMRGKVTLTTQDIKNLEDLVLPLNPVVVIPQPSWEHVLNSYTARKAEEYVTDTSKLFEVYDMYLGGTGLTSLSVVTVDMETLGHKLFNAMLKHACNEL